jgi:Zn ribbon nucleic-acid-binding protein
VLAAYIDMRKEHGRDSDSQIAAKIRGAKRRECPACKRRNALSARHDLWNPDRGEVVGHVRECRWCGHEVGMQDGIPFGR